MRLHRLLLSEIADREVLVAHHETDLPLPRLASHLPAEAAELGEVAVIFDIGWRRVAVDDHRLILDESATSLVVTGRGGRQ
ncbi:MAG: hypothetical protein E6J65_27165 [Deltaproteobacteria bacterium]|nr:MAG: hypothetical protein E6J65_27165 [Deltaproteobacteria bacterium]